ncbi:MAG: methyltransferase domain-containing protein [Micropepsaceae bacterium]
MSIENLKDYYGRILKNSSDLKTSACCLPAPPPRRLQMLLADIHDEVKDRFYGCGLIAPEVLDGATVIDLGCGAGRDAYLLSRLVGSRGRVIGVDMTREQLAVANKHISWHMDKYGYKTPNVEFHEGYIEALDELPIPPSSLDVAVSNCVINLSPDKARVFQQAFRLLKLGGELYFSDVYADRRLPPAVQNDPVLHAECVGGALYWNDFLYIAKRAGFLDPRLVTSHEIQISDPLLKAQVGATRFFSATYRLFKIDNLEPACEDYGQAVVYKGGIEGAADFLDLDDHHRFDVGRVVPVCGNSLRMLKETRLSPYFEVVGEGARHFGLFPGCGTFLPYETTTASNTCC